MAAWYELKQEEEDKVWDRFYTQFSFRPSVNPAYWPGIKEPQPSITYSISSIYGAGEEHYQRLDKDLRTKTLTALRLCIAPDEFLYVLDWQHACYRFYPHPSYAGKPIKWLVPVLPNGDYYIFLRQDFTFGLFGHPWEQTICVFGEPFLNVLEKDKPLLFSNIIRKQ